MRVSEGIWGFPKIGLPFWGVPILRIILLRGISWVLLSGEMPIWVHKR